MSDEMRVVGYESCTNDDVNERIQVDYHYQGVVDQVVKRISLGKKPLEYPLSRGSFQRNSSILLQSAEC